MKTEDELYALFSEGSVITFVPKPELTVGTGALVPGVGGKKGTMVTFTPIGMTVVPEKEFGENSGSPVYIYIIFKIYYIITPSSNLERARSFPLLEP